MRHVAFIEPFWRKDAGWQPHTHTHTHVPRSPRRTTLESRLPVKQNRLHQGDNIPAGVVSGTDDGHVDGLGSKDSRGVVRQSERTPPVLPTTGTRKRAPVSCGDHHDTKSAGERSEEYLETVL